MSQSPTKPQQEKKIRLSTPIKEYNNNTNSKSCETQNARIFISWYKQMIDHDRQNFTLYLSDGITIEWFGRTIKSRKKVAAFLCYNMQCTRHDFITVDSIEQIPPRLEATPRSENAVHANPLNSPEICDILLEKHGKKQSLRSNCNSSKRAENCGSERESEGPESKKMRNSHTSLLCTSSKVNISNQTQEDLPAVESSDISNKGDNLLCKRALKRKRLTDTPPKLEKGQGDCLPSTSGTDFEKSHDTLNAQLLRRAVECDGYVEFTRTKSNRSRDSAKWERKCKVQISYSNDPINIGEYIIWSIRYHDEGRCKRNLLAAFEEVAKEEESKNK